jgi:putative acetyltransferase
MDPITIRPETNRDIDSVGLVYRSAFEGDAEAGLVEALRESRGFVPELSLVAEFRGRVVGHILLTRVRLQRGGFDRDILALGPMAVRPSQSHRGIGSLLVQTAVNQAKGLGFGAIVVAGYRHFYERFGFDNATRWGLACNLDVPSDEVAAMELKAGTLAHDGDVIYPPQFSQVY